MATRDAVACAGIAAGAVFAIGSALGSLPQWWPASLLLGLVVLLVEAE